MIIYELPCIFSDSQYSRETNEIIINLKMVHIRVGNQSWKKFQLRETAPLYPIDFYASAMSIRSSTREANYRGISSPISLGRRLLKNVITPLTRVIKKLGYVTSLRTNF